MGTEPLQSLRAGAVGAVFGEGDLTVEYCCIDAEGATSHHQVFESGRLVRWDRGPAAAPDLRLRQPSSINDAMLARVGSGEDILRQTHLVDARSGALVDPPPLDETDVGWADELPSISTAGSMVVEQSLTGTPYGIVRMHFRLERGRLTGAGLGPATDADMVVERSFALALAERAGKVDILDSMAGGQVAGDARKITLFLGIYDSEECGRARRSLSVHSCEELARLGWFLSSPAWARLVARSPVALSGGGAA
jgi:hypothetical protein